MASQIYRARAFRPTAQTLSLTCADAGSRTPIGRPNALRESGKVSDRSQDDAKSIQDTFCRADIFNNKSKTVTTKECIKFENTASIGLPKPGFCAQYMRSNNIIDGKHLKKDFKVNKISIFPAVPPVRKQKGGPKESPGCLLGRPKSEPGGW